MCELFIGADPDLWESRTKSLRIDGMATSIRVERFFWDILEEIAARDAMTVNQLITKLYHESLDADHDLGNFTSFLRVCCGRYLALASNGEVPRDAATPLAGVDAPGHSGAGAGGAGRHAQGRRHPGPADAAAAGELSRQAIDFTLDRRAAPAAVCPIWICISATPVWMT